MAPNVVASHLVPSQILGSNTNSHWILSSHFWNTAHFFFAAPINEGLPWVGGICTEPDLTTFSTLHHEIQLMATHLLVWRVCCPKAKRFHVTHREDDIMSRRLAACFTHSFFHRCSCRRRGALCPPSLLLCSVTFLPYSQSLIYSYLVRSFQIPQSSICRHIRSLQHLLPFLGSSILLWRVIHFKMTTAEVTSSTCSTSSRYGALLGILRERH